MFGISFEHLIIVGIILLVVGPRRLPELGHTMGKAIKNFKDSFTGVEEASFKRIEPKNNTASNTNTGPTAETINVNANTTSTTSAPETHV